jgi:uncharacterized membrane protein
MPEIRPEIASFTRTRQGVRNLDTAPGHVLPLSGKPASRGEGINVGPTERALSSMGGASLIGFGLAQGSLTGLCMALLGGALLYRGTTGHCHLYAATGINTAEPQGSNIQREHAYRLS